MIMVLPLAPRHVQGAEHDHTASALRPDQRKQLLGDVEIEAGAAPYSFLQFGVGVTRPSAGGGQAFR